MKLSDFLNRVEELIVMGETTLKTKHTVSYYELVERTQFRTFRSASLSFLSKLFGEKHPYYLEFDLHVGDANPSSVEAGLGVLHAVKNELSSGWLISTKSIISAEIFSDFLEMASYLLDEGYKDASAVMVGSILEEHLRQLCLNAHVSLETTKASGDKVPKKADMLNADLAKQGVYSALDQKNVTAWLDLRNKAAHGRYSEYTSEQVMIMHQGVLEFMARIPS